MNYSFKKIERINKREDINELFNSGNQGFVYPFKYYFVKKPNTEEQPNKVLISVPKKKFKKAFKRNHIKRMIRESYRLNKHFLKNEGNFQFHIALIYVGDDSPKLGKLQKSLRTLLSNIDY